MKQLSTSDQLLLMAYGELNNSDARILQEQLKADIELAQEYYYIKELAGDLHSPVYTPSDTSLKIVLEYSNKTEHLQEI